MFFASIPTIMKTGGYEQKLHEKNMQLTKLKFYINNITSCLCILVLSYERRKDHRFNTLIKCSTIFISQLYTNQNSIQQASDIHQNFRELYKPNPIFIPNYVSTNQHTLRIH